MEEMIARWIRETETDYELAKSNQNLFRMKQMLYLRLELKELRNKALKTHGI